MTPDISAYLSFVLGIFLAFGLAFEVPIATVLLIWSGLVSVKALKNARPYMFLGSFVAGMLLAPDVFSMTLMAIPMYLLYEGGFIMARVDLGEFGRVEPIAVMDTIGVDPDYRGQGIGRALLSQLIVNLTTLRVEQVRTEIDWRDRQLLGFLDHCGFHPSQQICFEHAIDTGRRPG